VIHFETIEWLSEGISLLDQRLLPSQERFLLCKSWEALGRGIKEMAIRGAPAIGIAAAMGIALAAQAQEAPDEENLTPAFTGLAATRPTAVNLFWALERMRRRLRALEGQHPAEIKAGLLTEALKIKAEDLAMCKAMGAQGAKLLPEGARVLTHCNAGALATGGYGTALGMIRSAWAQKRLSLVYADETRPFLQGARLTAWELQRDGIPVRVITDNMAAHFMGRGAIDAVIVGTDRIAANGDVANKIGTYGLAILCKHHGIPFYVVGPSSTIDLACPRGEEIPIEERPREEVSHIGGERLVPEGVPVENPAFDITPAELISAIITEHGVARSPYVEILPKHLS